MFPGEASHFHRVPWLLRRWCVSQGACVRTYRLRYEDTISEKIAQILALAANAPNDYTLPLTIHPVTRSKLFRI